MPKEQPDTLRFTMIVACLMGGLIFAYFFLGWDTGRKIDNATYANRTLAESGPYALTVTANPGISDHDKQLVEETLSTFFGDKGFDLVDAQMAVNEGGSVLAVHLDTTPIDPSKKTFSVDMKVMVYVYRISASGNYYQQGADIYTAGKHGHATNDVFHEAISTTALNMAKEFHTQYEQDNP